MSPRTRTFKVVNKPHRKFPYGPGAQFTIPADLKKWEYVVGKKYFFINIDEELKSGNLVEITSPTKEELKEKCTLDSIKSDYDQYGYLEDYQVEWLIDELFDTRHLLFNIIEKNEYIGNGIHKIEMTKELLHGIKNKLKK